MLIQALGLLCALAAVTFTAVPIGSYPVRVWPAAVVGFVAAAVWLRPEPISAGLLIVVVAGIQLLWPKRGWLLMASGLVAGLWASSLGSQGFPTPAAWLLAIGLTLASAWLSARRPKFAPTVLREEALSVGAPGDVTVPSHRHLCGMLMGRFYFVSKRIDRRISQMR